MGEACAASWVSSPGERGCCDGGVDVLSSLYLIFGMLLKYVFRMLSKRDQLCFLAELRSSKGKGEEHLVT